MRELAETKKKCFKVEIEGLKEQLEEVKIKSAILEKK